MTELGNRLREAREEKGWSLDDLQQVTKIQKRYLRGIEEGNYNIMPGPFYVRAFIKQYAEVVGLDSEELFEQYEKDLPQVVADPLPELSRVKSRKVSDTATKLLDIFPKILIAVFIIGALTLAYYFWSSRDVGDPGTPIDNNDNTQITLEEREQPDNEENDNNNNDDNETDTNENDAKNAENDAENNAENAENENNSNNQELTFIESSGRTSTYKLTNSDSFNVKVVSTGESWVEIKNGKGYTFFSGMLTEQQEGETVDMTNESEALIVIGRSTEAEIFINDEKLPYEISPTEEVRQDIIIKFDQE